MTSPRPASPSGCLPAQAPAPSSSARPAVTARRTGGASSRGRRPGIAAGPCKASTDLPQGARISAVSASATGLVFQTVVPGEARSPSPGRGKIPAVASRCRHAARTEHESCVNDPGNFADSNNCNTCNICTTSWGVRICQDPDASYDVADGRSRLSAISAAVWRAPVLMPGRMDFPPFPHFRCLAYGGSPVRAIPAIPAASAWTDMSAKRGTGEGRKTRPPVSACAPGAL